MNKTKKIVVSVAAVAAVACCGAALAGCGETTSTTKTYSLTTTSWSDYTAENEVPFAALGDGAGTIFDFSTWIGTGNKVKFDDDGNMLGVSWTMQLDIEESPVVGYHEYTFSLIFHAEPSELYTVATDGLYTAKGYAYDIDGGYHLGIAHYASFMLVGQAMAETGGFDVDNTISGPNGETLTYFYTDSNLQASGVVQSFLAEDVLKAFCECDVQVNKDAIVKFENVAQNYFKWTNEPGSLGGGCDCENGGNGDTTPEPTGPIEDNEVNYSFAPGWLNMPEFAPEQDPAVAKVTMTAGCYNSHVMGGAPMGWGDKEVTFEFKADGTVTITMVGGSPNPNVYTGTYKSYLMQQKINYVIQLDNIPGAENPDGSTSEGTTWDLDKVTEAGPAVIGNDNFYWISAGGRIVLTADGDGYIFNVAQQGGGGPQA